MDTNCVQLLPDVCLYSYEVEFVQVLLHEKKKTLTATFNITFRYIDVALSIDNNNFHSHVDSIYPSELEIKQNRVFHVCFIYGYLLSKKINCRLITQLYNKLGEFNFSIVNLPYLCSNLPSFTCIWRVFSLIRYARPYSA